MNQVHTLRMGRNRWKGQALIEFAMTIPVMVCIFLMCYDLGKMSVIKHKLQQAAYEGIKITSTTVVDIHHVPCSGADAGDKNKNLCAAVKDRVDQVLQAYSIDTSLPGYKKEFTLFTDPLNVDDDHVDRGDIVTFLVKLEITYPYTYLLGKLLAFTTVNLKVDASTRYISATAMGKSAGAKAAFDKREVVTCDEVYSGVSADKGRPYFNYGGRRYKPICA